MQNSECIIQNDGLVPAQRALNSASAVEMDPEYREHFRREQEGEQLDLGCVRPYSESRMRENCTSGSTSGKWKRSKAGLVRPRHTKEPDG